VSDSPFPPGFFDRADESADDQFYREARLVTHIDDATIDAIREAYAELLPSGAAVLDLMSSWISHLPPSAYERVSGLGMNEHELVANPQLDDHVVHDLNREPELPYTDRSFDAVLNAVSIQYLTRPVDVYASVRRVLRPGGLAIVATSHRIFPTKAIRGWQQLQPVDRPRLVAHYLQEAGGYEAAEILDRSPAGADPLWLVCARTTGGASR
jgi:hypothetical protein